VIRKKHLIHISNIYENYFLTNYTEHNLSSFKLNGKNKTEIAVFYRPYILHQRIAVEEQSSLWGRGVR